jgi:hypothetical protein
MPCLTIIDVTGIQDYIFGSNRLKEIVGASEIVTQATSWWIFDVLRDLNLKWTTNLFAKSNSHKSPFDAIDTDSKIEEKNLDAEIIYAGGGNTLILFADKDKAVEFTQKYTLKLIKDARGLETVIAHSEEFEMSNGKIITEIVENTFEELNLKKANRKVSTPLLGLAVSAQCVSTGGVATQFDGLREKYISTESYQKQAYDSKANKRLKEEVLQQLDWKGLKAPSDFDDLGRTRGEASYIAVVHTDGNGMGKRVEKVGELAGNNREWIIQMRNFSESIYKANISAMEKTIEQILWKINGDKKELIDDRNEKFDLSQNKEKTETYFPFRPLIFGGDDLTFVCDGRIALSLTAFYLNELLKINLSDDKPIYARAGISIIKSHYPFSRAYKLAEELVKSTKERIKHIDEENKEVTAIDWHVAMSGLLGNLEEIREREYTTSDGKLTMRPLVLHPQNDESGWRTWQTFSEIINEFQGENWKDRRNKLKALREVFRKGKDESKSYVHLNKIDLPVKAKEDGWENDACVHFDAIEMLDLFYPIEKVEEKKDE